MVDKGVCLSHAGVGISHTLPLLHGRPDSGKDHGLCRSHARVDSGVVVGRARTSLWVNLAFGQEMRLM